MTLAALLELQARDPTLIEQRLLAAEIEEVLSDEREWGANPIAVLRMRSRAGALRAHFKHTTPLRPAAALLVRGFGHTQQEALMNECVAWHLARCMGPRYAALLAPTVWRTGVPVGTGAGALSLHLAGAPALTVTDPAQVDAAALFDSISWQQDRHCDNYLWDPARRRLALIDHSFSLPASRPERPAPGGGFFLKERWWHGREQLTDAERASLTRLRRTLGRLDGVLDPARYDALHARVDATLASNRVALPRTRDLAPGDQRLPRRELKRRLGPRLSPHGSHSAQRTSAAASRTLPPPVVSPPGSGIDL